MNVWVRQAVECMEVLNGVEQAKATDTFLEQTAAEFKQMVCNLKPEGIARETLQRAKQTFMSKKSGFSLKKIKKQSQFAYQLFSLASSLSDYSKLQF